MWILTVKYEFDAAHSLPDVEGPCVNLHGHRWVVEANVRFKELGKGGVAMDFKRIKADLHSFGLDHTYLNEVLEDPPSAENVARYFYRRLKSLGYDVVSVRVWETPNYAATYYEK
ncbi:MAG: 6-carboxytetrahydropterin synthase [Thermotogae bacterium]|nr:6-carboxytetrahydropterin synthase [Thermotogota bacterium]